MKKVSAVAAVWALPLIAAAQSINSSYLESIRDTAQNVLNWAIPFLIGLAFVWFLYNVFAYIIKTDPDGKEGARKQMIYGIIGLAIMIAAWGLVKIVVQFFGVGGTTNVPQVPSIPGGGF